MGPKAPCDARCGKYKWPLDATSASRRLRSTFLSRTCRHGKGIMPSCFAHAWAVASRTSHNGKDMSRKSCVRCIMSSLVHLRLLQGTNLLNGALEPDAGTRNWRRGHPLRLLLLAAPPAAYCCHVGRRLGKHERRRLHLHHACCGRKPPGLYPCQALTGCKTLYQLCVNVDAMFCMSNVLGL